MRKKSRIGLENKELRKEKEKEKRKRGNGGE